MQQPLGFKGIKKRKSRNEKKKKHIREKEEKKGDK
jgi:hypothetical protein